MRGTDGADTLVGTGDADSIYGAGGNDLIQGLGGTDVLVGQDGDDTLYGGDGNDYLVGGGGNDVLFGGDGVDWADYGDAAGAVTLDLSRSKAQDTHGAGVDILISIERVYGSAFGDAITGGKYDNLLSGADGADTLTGGGGRDSLIGGAGDDRLDGGAGRDYLEGGAGNDTYVVASKADLVVEAAGCGVDTVQASVSYHLGDNLENLRLDGGRAINGWGNALDNTIIAGAGANHLYGGAGADTFQFTSLAALNGDTVGDYQNGDQIDLHGIDADVNTAGDQVFHLTGSFTGGPGQARITYDAAHNLTYIDLDVDGDKVSDATLTLTGDHQSGVSFVL